jgi:hypothetical protein
LKNALAGDTLLAPELVEVGVFHSPSFVHSRSVGD